MSYGADLLIDGGIPFFEHQNRKLTIPFDYIHHHIVLHLNVNGRGDQSFLFDSGSTASAVSLELVHSLHLKTIRNSRLDLRSRDAVNSGLIIAHHVRISGDHSTLTTGNISKVILAGDLPTFDMSRVQTAYGIPISGILGYDYIRQFPILIDYANRTITIYPDKKLRYVGPGAQLKVEKSELPTVDASIKLADGTLVNAVLNIDTGSDRALELSEPFGKRYDLASRNTGPSTNSVAVSMSSTGTMYRQIKSDIQLLTIGPINIKNPRTYLAVGISKGELASSEWDGDIGNRLLESYRVFFDIPRGILVLEPPPSTGKPQ